MLVAVRAHGLESSWQPGLTATSVHSNKCQATQAPGTTWRLELMATRARGTKSSWHRGFMVMRVRGNASFRHKMETSSHGNQSSRKQELKAKPTHGIIWHLELTACSRQRVPVAERPLGNEGSWQREFMAGRAHGDASSWHHVAIRAHGIEGSWHREPLASRAHGHQSLRQRKLLAPYGN